MGLSGGNIPSAFAWLSELLTGEQCPTLARIPNLASPFVFVP